MTISHWRRGGSPTVVETDVVVVGGGIVGVSAALALRERGVSCFVLERGGLGAGASSRNAGFLMRGAADNYFLAAEHHGREMARFLWKWTEENLAMLRRRGVEALGSYRATPSCLLALSPDSGELGEIRRSFEMMQEDGFAARWLEKNDDAAWGRGMGKDARVGVSADGAALGGLVNPNDAVVNPVELLRLLASQFSDGAKWRIIEQQEVVEVVEVGSGVEVRTADLRVRCGRVLFCLNAYARTLFPEMARLIEPNRAQMMAIRAPASAVRLDFAYYANRGSEYFRRADAETVVVGGCRTYHAAAERTLEDVTTGAVQGDLERFARRVLGIGDGEMEVVARWAGIMGFTPDHLPLIGPVVGTGSERVWWASACTGHGMSMGHKAGEVAVGAMLGECANPFGIERLG